MLAKQRYKLKPRLLYTKIARNCEEFAYFNLCQNNQTQFLPKPIQQHHESVCTSVSMTGDNKYVQSSLSHCLLISSLSVTVAFQHGKWGLNSKFDEQDSLCPLVNSPGKYELVPTGHLH